MARPGPRRENAVVRMSDEQKAQVDRRAVADGLTKRDGTANRSEWVRLAIKYALTHMPHNWRPE